jgi:hypothetical protein
MQFNHRWTQIKGGKAVPIRDDKSLIGERVFAAKKSFPDLCSSIVKVSFNCMTPDQARPAFAGARLSLFRRFPYDSQRDGA